MTDSPSQTDGEESSARELSESSEPGAFDPERERAALELVLKKTRRGRRWPVLAEGFLWYVTTIAAVMLSALMVAGVVQTTGGAALGGWIVRGGLAIVTLISLWIGARWVMRPESLATIASRVQQYAPQLRNDLVSSLQFAREIEFGTVEYSQELASEHVKRTTRKVLEMARANKGLAHLLPARNLHPAAAAASASVVLVVAIALIWPSVWDRVSSSAGVRATQKADDGATKRPIVGGIDLRYDFPSYTSLEPRFEAYASGHIETLIGTEVTLETYALFDADRYQLILETADGSRAVPLETKGSGLRAEFRVLQSGTYHFRAVREGGEAFVDGNERRIRIVPDEAPTVTITSHEGTVEVGPDDVLKFEFSVADDYGIDGVRRSWAFQGEDPDRAGIELSELSQKPTEIQAEYSFDLRPLDLQPKDMVVFTIEAVDTNTLTGPGVGQSQEVVLRVASPEDKHMRVIAEQQAIFEALLQTLAAFLEAPVGERVHQVDHAYRQMVQGDVSGPEATRVYSSAREALLSLSKTLEAMEETVESMKNDPMTLKRDFEIFSSLHRELDRLAGDAENQFERYEANAESKSLRRAELQRLADHMSKIEDALEKGVLQLEDLLASQKMNAIEATAQDIEEMRERLRELLTRYKETQDPELKKAIEREVKRLRQRMQELMSRMQSQLQKLPQEHVNMEALKAEQLESDSRQLAESMESIEDLLEKGDIDGALEALDRMGENLEALNSEMNQQFGEAQPEGLNELDQKLSELMDEVNDLEALQRSVEEQTSEAQRAAQADKREQLREMMEELKRDLQRQVQRQQTDSDRLAGEVPRFEQRGVTQAKQALDRLEQGLESDDFDQALDASRKSLEELKSLQFGIELSQRYAPKDSAAANKAQKSLDRLGTMVERGDEIRSGLESMMEEARQQMSQQDTEELQQLQQRQRQVNEESQKLEESVQDASQKFPMLEQLGQGVESARDAMGEAEGALGERKAQRAIDHQRSALDQLGKLKKSMQETLQKERMQQGRQQQRERVEIPVEDSRDTQKKFREDVLENMREGRLESYSEEIERYYRSLME